jgi:hypothetical protein
MSNLLDKQAPASAAGWLDRRDGGRAGLAPGWAAPDTRRLLQLGLAALWLADALLQIQSFMFSKAFGQTLAATAPGNPAVIADPISWSARLIEAHPTWTNAAFASVQLFLALGIAWRPTVKLALAGSVAWSLGVWWIGEGLGGVLNGTADPVTGAPGAVILYALLAVLLWPTDRAGPFEAARPFGTGPARLAWLALWGSFGYFALLGANRAAQRLHSMMTGMAVGEPGWLASLDRGTASLLAGRGTGVSVVLALVFVVIAAGIYLPGRGARAAAALAAAVALLIWLAGENFGGILAGSGTDPNTGPVLVLLAAAYWPRRAAVDGVRQK